MNQSNIIIRLSVLDKKLTSLDTKVNIIQKQLQEIVELLNDNKKDCKKMSSHIDFIDSVYDKLKMPIDFVCGKVNNVMSLQHASHIKMLGKD